MINFSFKIKIIKLLTKMSQNQSKSNNFQSNNSHLEWIFEKLFEQLTENHKNLFILPFDQIHSLTFENPTLHNIIGNFTSIPKEIAKEHINDSQFKHRFIHNLTNNKIHTVVLLGNFIALGNLLNLGYEIDEKTIELIIRNNQIEMLKIILTKKPSLRLTNDLLMIPAEYSYTEMYFYLKEFGLVPNISVYNSASVGHSMEIFEDISHHIGIST